MNVGSAAGDGNAQRAQVLVQPFLRPRFGLAAKRGEHEIVAQYFSGNVGHLCSDTSDDQFVHQRHATGILAGQTLGKLALHVVIVSADHAFEDDQAVPDAWFLDGWATVVLATTGQFHQLAVQGHRPFGSANEAGAFG
ncbi:hypothetical protein D3C76_1283000 [compost metagenome]